MEADSNGLDRISTYLGLAFLAIVDLYSGSVLAVFIAGLSLWSTLIAAIPMWAFSAMLFFLASRKKRTTTYQTVSAFVGSIVLIKAGGTMLAIVAVATLRDPINLERFLPAAVLATLIFLAGISLYIRNTQKRRC
jgi:hypothetical protein